jgi:hypothetical protein
MIIEDLKHAGTFHSQRDELKTSVSMEVSLIRFGNKKPLNFKH